MFTYAILTAGGRGDRLLPLTDYIPKAMVEVKGVTLIAGLIRQLRPAVSQVVVTVGYKGDRLAKHVIDEGVSAIFETTGKSDCWWVFNTLMRYVDEPVIVLACDLVVELDLKFIYDAYVSTGSPICMMIPIAVPGEAAGHFIIGEGGKVSQFSRKKISNLLASGIYVLNPRRVNEVVKCAENVDQMWASLMQAGELFCSPTYVYNWYTIDTIEQLRQVK